MSFTAIPAQTVSVAAALAAGTLLTIAIAWFVHRPLIGGGMLAAAAVLFVLLRQMHRRPALGQTR